MIIKINVFGITCKYCNKPFKVGEFMHADVYAVILPNGDLDFNTGYSNFYHSKCKSDNTKKLER